MESNLIVYTYLAGATPPCHAYGPMTRPEADELVKCLLPTAKGLTAMILPLEATPTLTPAPAAD